MLKAITLCDQICAFTGAIKSSFIYISPGDAAQAEIRWKGDKYRIRIDFIEEIKPPVCGECGRPLKEDK